ncbi:MAG: HAD family phosphatase [Clostridia bacterium]|nr:HAD family phosphatase [Clostridia bacterium]
MIKNVIFDLGGVMVGFRCREVIKELGYPPEEVEKLLGMTLGSPEYIEGDRGLVTFDEKVDIMCKNHPEYSEDIRKIMSHVSEFFYLFNNIKGIINDVKAAGYGMYYLSNTSEDVDNNINGEHHLFEMFDGGIRSYKEHLLKPEPEIYKLLLDRYGLAADECLFVDDLENNTKGANAVGIHTITLKDQSKLREELIKQGVKT